MQNRHILPLFALAWASQACGPQAPASSPASSPTATKASAGTAAKSSETPQGPAADVLYAPHAAIPAPASTCIQGSVLPPRVACETAREDLAVALGADEVTSDTELAKLEACKEFPPGLIRALRAELGTAECADVLVAPVVGEGKETTNIPADVREALVALGLGARLRRLAVDPPLAPKTRKKELLQAYFTDQLFPWISEQAQAIFEMAHQGTGLSSYARGVVAIEAGNADMRFVEIARGVPVAEEIAKYPEATDVYYATLDEQLEPRKTRGRNAALVGLREMARIGVRSSARVDSARALLSRAYGGRRVNALDALMVSSLDPEKAQTDAAAIASRVPTAYATILVGDAPLSANLVRAHLQQGMPVGLRRAVESSTGHAVEKLLLARALFESGRAYFRAEDFQAAQALLTPLLDVEGPDPASDAPAAPALSDAQQQEAVLLRALSVALVAGPKDAAEMIAQGPRFASSLGNLVLLEGLGSRPGEMGGRARFNTAYLRELVAPEGDPDYWKDLAKRYQEAAPLLKGNEARISRERSAACREIEKTVRAQLKKAPTN